jgi:peptide/nickel transport system substrate-binding protein
VGLILAAAATVWALLSPGTGASSDSSHRYGGHIRLAFSMPITGLDPYSYSFGSQVEIYPLIYSFLLIPDDNWGFQPDLALRWWSEKGEKKWIFKLRPQARFHDGTYVTSDDAAYSFRRLCQINSLIGSAVADVATPDRHTLAVTLKRRVPDFLAQLSLDCHIVPRSSARSHSGEPKPIGSGPFMVDSAESDRRVVLKAFPDHYKGRPYLDSIACVYEPDKEKIWLDFMHDDYQACWALSSENVNLMRADPAKYTLKGRVAQRAAVLLFNTRAPLFNDKRVRRALAQLLDMSEHVAVNLNGLAEPCPGPLGLHSPYLDGVTGFGSDVEAAKRALAEVGWQDHDWDRYRDKDGQPMEFELLVPVSSQTESETAVYLQRRLNQFGIKAHLVIKSYDRILEENLIPGNFEACLTQHNTNPSTIYTLSGLWSGNKGIGLANYTGYGNDRLDRLFDHLAKIEDGHDTALILQEINEILIDDQPAVWLYHDHMVNAFSHRLKGLEEATRPYYLTYPLIHAWLDPQPESR